MKIDFAQYPEVILLDATYKLNDLQMPLYLMLVTDGNGESQVVMTCLTVTETEEAITQMIKTFKTHNPEWKNVKFAMTDKDMVERTVLKREMPQLELGLCLFHTLRTFKREVSTSKLGISQQEVETSSIILQDLAYSRSPLVYAQLHEKLSSSYPPPHSVVEYFNKIWHPIRHEWVQCLKSVNYNLGETTTNRVESWNSKIKSVCSSYSTLFQFYKDFLALIKTMRNERLHKLIMDHVRVESSIDSKMKPYRDLCTGYAFNIISAQYQKSDKVTAEDLQRFDTTDEKSTCSTFTAKLVPCKHFLP